MRSRRSVRTRWRSSERCVAPIGNPSRHEGMRIGWRPLLIVAPIVLSACNALPPRASDPATGGGLRCDVGPSFPSAALDGPPGAENGDDPAAEALRRHLATDDIEIEWLPDAGWIEISRTDSTVHYLAPDPDAEGSWLQVSVGRDGEGWNVDGWGGCSLQPDVGAGLGIASFRVAPNEGLEPTATEIAVLVTERACNSGEDARGRIVVAAIEEDDQSVTVTLAVRPRGGGQDCPSNPETPFVVELPEPLGNRAMLDGSTIPPRDATTCPDIAMCP
jgi:hypothetical protein